MALDAASCRKYKVPELLGGLPDELKKDVGFGEGPIGYARGLEGYTNEVIRKRLAEEWSTLPKDEQVRLRAVRAKRGIKCDRCGARGYYRENCPKNCSERPRTPDSDEDTDSPPSSPEDKDKIKDPGKGLGVLWGNMGFGDDAEKTSLLGLRYQSKKEGKRFDKSDKSVHSFNFLQHAEQGYNRDLAELTLHQLLRRMIRTLEKALHKNVKALESSFDTTLLHPPKKKPGNEFYPEKLRKVKQYKEYFAAKTDKIERMKKTYMYRGHLRSDDCMDVVMRGNSLENMHLLYKPDPDAMQSVHAKLGWKQIMNKYDDLANSDPNMVKKAAEVKALFKAQGAWAHAQQNDMQFTNDRFEHLVYIFRQEIHAEHERENLLLKTTEKKALRHLLGQVWIKRYEAVDRIVDTIEDYGLASGLDDLDLIMFTLKEWKSKKLENKRNEKLRYRYKKKRKKVKKEEKRRMRKGLVGAKIGLHELVYYDPASNAPNTENDMDLDMDTLTDSGGSLSASEEGDMEGEDGQDNSVLRGGDDDDSEEDPDWDPMMGASNANGEGPSPYVADLKYLRQKERVALEQRMKLLHDTRELPPLEDEDEAGSASAKSKRSGSIVSKFSGGEKDSDSDNERKNNKKKKKKIPPWLVDRNVRKVNMTQQEKDQIEMDRLKKTYKESNFSKNLREGTNADQAHLMPALIPVPKTFVDEGPDLLDPLKSKVADEIIWKTRQSMIDVLAGYTPQKLLPLYVRNTLMEKNGTQAHGDQPLEVMARDKRYSHYMGRPFAHFDSHGYHPDLFGKTNAQPFYSPYRRTPPKKGKGSTLQLRPISAGGGSGGAKKTSKNTLLTKEERKLERERHKKNSLSASDALLRLSFTGHRENETDYLYSGGMREGT